MRHAGLILIHCFSLSLLFHNHRALETFVIIALYKSTFTIPYHRSLLVPIRGYHHKPPYFTLAFLHFFLPFLPLPPSSLSSSPPFRPYFPPLRPYPHIPSSSFRFIPWGRWRRRLSRLFIRISQFAKRLSVHFIGHFLQRITATARRSELELMQQFNRSLMWIADSVTLTKYCWLCDIGILRALICCSLFLYRRNTLTCVAYRWRALWGHWFT